MGYNTEQGFQLYAIRLPDQAIEDVAVTDEHAGLAFAS